MLTRRYIEFVLRRRLAVLLVCGGITALAGWQISGAVLASSVVELFFGENPKYERYRQRYRGSDPKSNAPDQQPEDDFLDHSPAEPDPLG